MNVRVALVRVETWTDKDGITVDRNISKTLSNFLAYKRKNLDIFKGKHFDNVQFISYVQPLFITNNTFARSKSTFSGNHALWRGKAERSYWFEFRVIKVFTEREKRADMHSEFHVQSTRLTCAFAFFWQWRGFSWYFCWLCCNKFYLWCKIGRCCASKRQSKIFM